MKQIIMYKTTWCGDCKRSEKFLRDNDVQYKEVNIDEDREAAGLVEKLNGGYRSVPTIVFPNGKVLIEPSNQALAEALQENFMLPN